MGGSKDDSWRKKRIQFNEEEGVDIPDEGIGNSIPEAGEESTCFVGILARLVLLVLLWISSKQLDG